MTHGGKKKRDETDGAGAKGEAALYKGIEEPFFLLPPKPVFNESFLPLAGGRVPEGFEEEDDDDACEDAVICTCGHIRNITHTKARSLMMTYTYL